MPPAGLVIAPDQPPTAPAAEPMVSLSDVSVTFGEIVALEGVSLGVRAGDIVSLVGPSGSGKSTLLRVIAGVARPSSGRVCLAGAEVASDDRFVEPEHRRVGMVFQDYALFPHLTVAANVAFGLRDREHGRAEQEVGRLLERLGLSRYARSYPHMLSGGERQRVALARALAPQPRVLLMDEPFSGLDGRLRDRIRLETLDVLRETRTTTIVVTHDPGEALRLGDNIALMRAGRLLQYGPVQDVYARPATAFAARFLSGANDLPGVCRDGRVETPLGSFEAPDLADATPVRVCIRPQHVRVADGPTSISARVRSSEFLGESDWMTVEVPGLDAPVCLRTLGSHVGRGGLVFLDVDRAGVVVVPDDDRQT